MRRLWFKKSPARALANCETGACAVDVHTHEEHGHDGACPTCSHDASDWQLSRRNILSWLLGGVTLVLALSRLGGDTWRIFWFALSYLSFGGVILLRAVRNLFTGRIFDENMLMAVATLAAFAIGEYPEAVAVALFYRIGDALQERAADRSRASIRALVDWRPETVNRLVSGTTEAVAPEQVQPGERILLRPGDRVALDGEVRVGYSELDVSMLTGEPIPQEVQPGDEVLSGSINGSGVLELEVIRPYQESAAARILASAERSAARKARAERFITRFARIYTPVMVLLAVLLAALGPLVTGGTWQEWIYRACMLLVISCPCGLVLSVPLAYFAGIGMAARRGILVKGGTYLDRLAAMRTVAIDKTGTLTHGRPQLATIESAPGSPLSAEQLRRYFAAIERDSTHPVALAISQALADVWPDNAAEWTVENVREWPGKGMEAVVQGRTVVSGKRAFLLEHGVRGLIDEVALTHAPQQDQPVRLAVYLAVDGVYAGRALLEDRIRAEAPAAVQTLQKLGVDRVVMLTGDTEQAAAAVSHHTGVGEYHAHLLPDDKVERVEQLIQEQQGDGAVAFVGDGINDAPVLARADAGIAMGGSGSDAAIESADVVILSDRLTQIGDAVHIARKTVRVARQNVLLSLSVKAAVVVLATVGLGGIWQAVFADVGVALLAVLNALRVTR